MQSGISVISLRELFLNLFRLFCFTNLKTVRIASVLLIVLLLNGCAAIASMPIPLRIANNIHTGYSLYKNLDGKPENDSWYMSYLKSFIGKDKEEETLFAYEDEDRSLSFRNNSSLDISL